jgi:small-conductance mechanosensitive channel
MREQWKQSRQTDQRTPAGNLKAASRQEVINWVSYAWNKVSEEVVKKSFQLCGISLALDGSEDHLFSRRMEESMAASEINQEAADLLFQSDEFDGFSEAETDD